MEYEGRVDKTDKVQVTCPGDYCLTISEQGSDFNVYNGTCPIPSIAIMDCETNGVGCQNEKIGSTYIKVCCCNYALCNTSSLNFNFLSILFITKLYLLFLH